MQKLFSEILRCVGGGGADEKDTPARIEKMSVTKLVNFIGYLARTLVEAKGGECRYCCEAYVATGSLYCATCSEHIAKHHQCSICGANCWVMHFAYTERVSASEGLCLNHLVPEMIARWKYTDKEYPRLVYWLLLGVPTGTTLIVSEFSDPVYALGVPYPNMQGMIAAAKSNLPGDVVDALCP